MDDIVSVVIPAYNVENYISRSIESFKNQTYKNTELIIVDDGSNDRTYEIIQHYSKLDARIKIISQYNSGVSVARNRGIKETIGKYIVFLDADDWLEENTIQILLNLQKTLIGDGLVCVSPYINYLNNNRVLEKEEPDKTITPQKLNREQALMMIGKNDKVRLRSSCYKLYKADIIRKNDILFTPEIYNGEDGLFVFQYLQHVDEILFVPIPLWNVLKHQGSFTSSYNSRWLTAIDAVKYMIKEPDISEKVRNNLKVYLVDRAMGVAVCGLRSEKMTKEEFAEVRKVIKNNFYLWNKEQSCKIRILKRIVFLSLPYGTLKFFLKKVNNVKKGANLYGNAKQITNK